MAYKFRLPGQTFIGPDGLKGSEAVIKDFGKKAFIISGKNVSKTDAMKTLADTLLNCNIDWVLFNEITGEPTVEMIEAGVKKYKETGCDFVIGIGGGSPLDSAKAIAAMSVLEGRISDYMGKEIEGDFPPMVLIPTTAGTGSEATKFAVITDTERNIKMLLKGDALIPDLAIIDARFTITAPPVITASTGMDALTHAVEAYTSRRGNPLTDMYALSAIKRIFTFLPRAFDDGRNLAAREEMALAAYEAGVCINNASVTLVHGMSRPVGALFHVPHGLANAMLIKECLSYVLDGCYERFAAIGRVIGAANDQSGDQEAAKAFIERLSELCQYLKIPTLKEYGISKGEFDRVKVKMAEDAMASGSPSNTIKEVTRADLLEIYNRLW
ncbi:iron-containing alcohol dehydrogenase [Defluviitalea raffinosedens]|jgi:alcohol dehydrogenase class IV|uniref:Iron-containing alcohol dehydrogenase n=1 Tax=Defluviitalea raffinosedens TaxID=1450156 RepID=A0A7C8LJN4_9FIRM|nr:iron-containing alcohol dehydrogenase [Defluviitalea raffinosedens]KAE9630672.1 iron-containing alcohol dehydrogenase [Defluviitalea raffinosedens]MBM7686322.1 alcohol dehydrogenase class IV [Defluviitalea raffinosedens]MBZ4667160.1 alcohol dehydrogenase, class [Defluviitaleaceae bacterium]